ncbi:DUF6344 domain-containing protein [Streptomyces tubercidicus]|uniref:DUF6344 domain-containing protein n=1 Tax=Streptomyces tubercidicus TaxID=47759 RepID=UPI002E11F61E|nr:DUF6344 domain-containing protein [Streptomyces tubercidicus]
MAATKVMKFWAVCLVVLGKLLASLGVSAAASAARRDAALYERTLGKGNAGGKTSGGDVPEAERGAVPEPHPERRPHAVPAPRTVPLYGQAGPARRGFARPELPPTIKQRIRAEAHGTSPGMRSRLASGTESLTAAEHTAPAGTMPDADRATADARSTDACSADARSAVIPAARNRAHTARFV